MRNWAILLVLFGVTLSASASKPISVADLERTLTADHAKPDAQVAQQLADFELTERLSANTLAHLQSLSAGPRTAQQLRILADQSEFLPLPPSELPRTPAPDFAEQRKIMGLVVTYVSKTIHQLPNFYATRVTTSFEETPQIQTGTYAYPYQPLHPISASQTTVLYRDGQEVVVPDKSVSTTAKPQPKGLNAWGVFGPILSTVFLDAAKSKLTWSHWEQLPSGTRAVFQYSVPEQTSHYRATYCCLPGSGSPQTFDRVVSYHGEIAVDPTDGSIRRLTVVADLKSSEPIQRADIMVEYAPVEIAGKSYICATHSVALSSSLSSPLPPESEFRGRRQTVGAVDVGPPQTLLNDVAFTQYHMFRADSRILIATQDDQSTAPSSDTPTTPEVDTASPAPEPAEAPQPVQPQLPAPTTEVAAAAPPPQPQQTTQPPLDPASVFKVTTRQVIVDVVATKSDGQPLSGLTKEDFELKENGKPQTINFFEEHTQAFAAQAAPPQMPAMPVGAHTNVPPAPPADAVNVLLIDTLNTEVSDQAAVRKQVIDFLSKMPQGPRFAIFVLGSQLRCLQGFTSDSSGLIAALNDPKNGLRPRKDGSFQSQSDKADNADQIATLQVEQTSPYAIAALQAALADAGAHDMGARASMTFEALMYLGHYLSGIPGRKNLIWFSGSFPIVVVPSAEQMAALTKSAHPQDLTRIKQTAELFTASQIAIYPISAEGLTVNQAAAASSFAQGGGGGHQGGQDAGSIMASYNPGSGNSSAMEQLANSTGGKAFYNTNDLGGALKHAIDDGSHYYTIGYSPADKAMDGSYRKIEVKAVHTKTKLAYRRGYIASDTAAPVRKAKLDPLAPLLRLGLPAATGILYGVRAEPSAAQPSAAEARAGQNPDVKAPTTRFTVEFVVRTQDLSLQQTPQGDWTGSLLLGFKAYDVQGNPLNWQADLETLQIKPDQLDSLRKNGVTAQVDIDLPQTGAVHLVTAVFDPSSGTGGTLEIQLQSR